MKAVKVLIFLAGTGIAAGVLLANITTPALRSYRAEHSAHGSEADGQSGALVDDSAPRGALSEHGDDYSRQTFADQNDLDRQNNDPRHFAGSDADDNDDQSDIGIPRWLIGPERWLEQRGWIVVPSPRQWHHGETWGRHQGGQDDSRPDDDGWQKNGQNWGQQDRQNYASPSTSGSRGFSSAPSIAQPDSPPGQSAFDRAFGSPLQASSPGQAAATGAGNTAAKDAPQGFAQDSANDAATRARDAAADVLAAEGHTHNPAH